MKTNIIITFDTTGSMYPCLHEVRRKVDELGKHLFSTFPDLQISVITHGNLWDGKDMIHDMEFTNDSDRFSWFVKNIPAAQGGGYSVSGVGPPAAYEVALKMSYDSFQPYSDLQNNRNIIIMIGDSVPHRVGDKNYYDDKFCSIDWKEYLAKLQGLVSIYSVQCLDHKNAAYFYKELANQTEGRYITLDQFNNINDLLKLAVYSVSDMAMAETFAATFQNRGLQRIAQQILKKDLGIAYSVARADQLVPVNPSRFQVLNVDSEIAISDFVRNTGALYKKGKGFYSLTKAETIQENKEVVLVDKVTGDMFSGDEARNLIGVPFGQRDRINPRTLSAAKDWNIFVQSTSINRKLMPKTQFLYEVTDV